MIQSQYPNASEAIARAIQLQREWRETLESLAADWADQNVISQEPLTFRRHAFPHRPVVVLALQRSWQKQGWSTTAMDLASWRRLAETVVSERPQRYSLPGDIDVVANKNAVTLQINQSRFVQDPR